MDFAILAAGEGSRLKKEGISHSKPMVPLGGVPLIERLMSIFLKNGAAGIFVVINEHSPDVEAFLNAASLPVPLRVVRANTPSSLHSFYALLPHLTGDRLCLTTVDTVFSEGVFAAYISAFTGASSVDGLMAVTPFVDDESPLYVKTDDANKILAFLDVPSSGVQLVSGGIYCLRSTIFPAVRKAVESGIERMRNFQRLLIEEKLFIQAYPFPKIIDIDHAHDLKVAEEWLQNSR